MTQQEINRSKVCAAMYRKVLQENRQLKAMIRDMDREDQEAFALVQNHRAGVQTELSNGASRKIIRINNSIVGEPVEDTVKAANREITLIGAFCALAIALIPFLNWLV